MERNGHVGLDDEISTDEVLTKAAQMTTSIFAAAMLFGFEAEARFIDFSNALVDKIVNQDDSEDVKVLAGFMSGVALSEWVNKGAEA